MMRTRRWMGALIGVLALWTTPALAQVTIGIEDATPADGMAVVNVTLTSNGATVGGMQNDIIFDNRLVTLSAATQCRINPAIGLTPPGGDCLEDTSVGPCKNLSRVLNNCGETPLPPGCPSADPNLSRFRGIIAATAAPNNNAIPDGVLYTCTFAVVSTPAELTNANIVVSDPVGTRLDANGDGGTIGDGGTGPTPTPTEGGGEPTATPTFPTDVVVIDIGEVEPSGGMADVPVNLITNGMSVGGMQNDIIFNNTQVMLSAATACRINPAIGLSPPGGDCLEDTSVGPCKNLSRVLNNCGETPLPPGCPSADPNLSRFRGIIAATAAPNNNPIPDGPLYTCTFTVASTPAELMNANVVVSDPFGTRLDSLGAPGRVGPTGPPITPTTPVGPTSTPTEGVTPPTATRTSTPVTPVGPTSTVTVGATRTATPGETETPDEECSSTLASAATAGQATITLVNADCFPEGGGTIQIGSAVIGYSERVGNQLFLVSPLATGFPAGTTVTLLRGGGDDDDGCHINANASNSNAWLLLIPAVGVLALRRKQW